MGFTKVVILFSNTNVNKLKWCACQNNKSKVQILRANLYFNFVMINCFLK